MYDVHDWAEVRRLHQLERLSKMAIARRLGMSRTTVIRLLELPEPPRYTRERIGSKLDPHEDAIAAMLDVDARVPATVILEHLRKDGYAGGVTILKERVAKLRPAFLAAKGFQRTTYLPGELAHGDWWHTGAAVPVGNSASKEAYGWVTTLPHSAAHAVVYSLSKTMADFLQAVVACFERLGGVPEAMVVDNDSSIVADGAGRKAILHREVAALCGHLGMRLIVLEPGKPESKGQVERTNGYLDRSFLPLRSFANLDDMQSQCDDWSDNVAYRRHHRRVGGRVAEAWAAERRFLHALPDPLPDVDHRTEVRVQKDGFVRVRDVDYSVPPGLAGRKVQVRLSPREVVVHVEGIEIAHHRRSFAPADVVIDPRHARALRLAREARSRLAAGDVELEAVDLRRYDQLIDPPGHLSGAELEAETENASDGLSAARSEAVVA
ncbi:MAG: IS21 family transposase [Actinobacteria bacterium]|nr:IS21 family transposase [Actinomycetota bacterium]